MVLDKATFDKPPGLK